MRRTASFSALSTAFVATLAAAFSIAHSGAHAAEPALVSPSVTAGDEPSFFEHVVSCVVAMRPRALSVADQFIADGALSDPNDRLQLVELTEATLALTETAYGLGLIESDVPDMVTHAEETQQSMTPDAVVRLALSCLAEGESVIAKAQADDQARIHAAAEARVARLVSVR